MSPREAAVLIEKRVHDEGTRRSEGSRRGSPTGSHVSCSWCSTLSSYDRVARPSYPPAGFAAVWLHRYFDKLLAIGRTRFLFGCRP